MNISQRRVASALQVVAPIYGVTHVVATDGHSRFIPAGSTMSIKDNQTIYERIFR